MKTIITLVIFFASLTNTAFSVDYEKVMKTNIDKIYELKSKDQLNKLAKDFEQITNSKLDDWLPEYYSAYCYVRASVIEEMKEDEQSIQLDRAQGHIDNILKKNVKDSELYTLQALVYQLRITGMSTAVKYSNLSNEAIKMAEELDATNPRIYYLKGSNTFHTPRMFGGGKKKAKPYLEKAETMFENFNPENSLMPTWGNVHNSQLLKQCRN